MKIILIQVRVQNKMKALMTNSTHPDIFAAKMRDQKYVKHLRQVQKINNRQALSLKQQLKSYHHISDSYQKSKRQARQFDCSQQNIQIQRKNQQMNDKIKNIRSMFNFNNLKKIYQKTQSTHIQNDVDLKKEAIKSERYHENQEAQQINHISQQISQSITHGVNKISKVQPLKQNRISLHYYLRKRQQELIEIENEKIKKGILSQKSAYSPPKKLNHSLKLPNVKSARHNFIDQSIHDQTNKERNQKENQNKILSKEETSKP